MEYATTHDRYRGATEAQRTAAAMKIMQETFVACAARDCPRSASHVARSGDALLCVDHYNARSLKTARARLARIR
jgi:hypothetical protein